MTRDRALNERFLAAKEQMVICGSTLDEEIAFRVYRNRPGELPRVTAEVARGRATVREFVASEPRVEWVEPKGGVVAFLRIRDGVDVPRFYEKLAELRTCVGAGHWFEQDDRFFRVGFGWPTPEQLRRGLENVRAALAGAR